MSGLQILSIAPGATIQDRGRAGFLRYGVPSGGAMDLFALAEGQALLGNGADDAALEMAGFGGSFCATAPLDAACSGAEMALRRNGAPLGWRQTFHLEAGDTVEIGATRQTGQAGVYGYFHVAGGFQSEVMLGSRATLLRAGLGTVPAAGVLLATCPLHKSAPRLTLPPPGYFKRRAFRILWGPQSEVFTPQIRQAFLQTTFRIDRMRDRMGIRLAPDHGAFTAAGGLTIASDATNPGDIQITGDGVPVVLLADRGPSGGYPRIATLLSADQSAFAQVPTGETVTFSLVSRPEAVAAWRAFQRDIKALPEKTRPLVRDVREIADLLAYNLIDGVTRGDDDDDGQADD